jgi:Ca2+-binding RTX toxin-like protein
MVGKRLTVAIGVLAVSVATGAGPAAAKTLSGSKRGETLTGTKRADKIKGKGGADKLKGRGGNDLLSGGKGRDKLTGGKGADRHKGGAGNDTLRAADGRRDRVINGGPGTDTCLIDTALELAIVKGCESVQAGGPGGSGPGGSGPGAGGLAVSSFNGLVCDTPLPLCVFTISGSGADAPLGTVTGGGGVVGLGASVAITGPDWTAAGVYGCTGDGFLRVTIGSESVDLPVDCTA